MSGHYLNKTLTFTVINAGYNIIGHPLDDDDWALFGIYPLQETITLQLDADNRWPLGADLASRIGVDGR